MREPHDVLRTKDSWSGRVKMTHEQLLRNLEWWMVVPNHSNGRSIYKPVETAYMHVDSSGYGWGAVLNETTEARRSWCDHDRELHITYKELKAVREATDSSLRLSDSAFRPETHSLHIMALLLQAKIRLPAGTSRGALSAGARVGVRTLPTRTLTIRSGEGEKGSPGKLEPSGWSGGLEKTLFGENVGAREVTRGEVETDFSNKVWFNWDTEHIVKPPDAIASIVGLRSRACVPSDQAVLLSDHDAERLRNQVPGWRLIEKTKIETDFKVKSEEAGEELKARLQAVFDEQGHAPLDVTLANNTVIVALSTPSAGGLTENDYIVAAKLNEIDRSDLSPPKKQRFWA
eukprot:jgi/Tetstr1/442095/TSEL_030254.t1